MPLTIRWYILCLQYIRRIDIIIFTIKNYNYRDYLYTLAHVLIKYFTEYEIGKHMGKYSTWLCYLLTGAQYKHFTVYDLVILHHANLQIIL